MTFRWMVVLTALGAGANTCYTATAQAQETKPTFYLFVDSAGVGQIGFRTYQTWIWARSVNDEKAPPVAGVLASFDCAKGLTRRDAHVLFQLRPDSSGGVMGTVVTDNGTWGQYGNPKLFQMVSEVGDKKFKPASPYSES